MANKVVKPEVPCHIIAEFYWKNLRSGNFSAQTNVASKLRKLESCDCAQSKADDESFIFFF